MSQLMVSLNNMENFDNNISETNQNNSHTWTKGYVKTNFSKGHSKRDIYNKYYRSNIDKERTANKRILSISLNETATDSRPRIRINRQDKETVALLDTGANVSVIREDILKNWNEDYTSKITRLRGLGGEEQSIGYTNLLIGTDERLEKEIWIDVIKEIDEEIKQGINEKQPRSLGSSWLFPPEKNINNILKSLY